MRMIWRDIFLRFSDQSRYITSDKADDILNVFNVIARRRQAWPGSPFCILFENRRAEILKLSAIARTNC
ncbi:hypothetical protein, partial [Mesorhizobium helmanticense]|uniref:hypothetical protein n=1 Tax=Mesorhizobium helmanticense TaxID=1776423 RepID=UPI001ABF75D0